MDSDTKEKNKSHTNMMNPPHSETQWKQESDLDKAEDPGIVSTRLQQPKQYGPPQVCQRPCRPREGSEHVQE